jgi:hypothetical protein
MADAAKSKSKRLETFEQVSSTIGSQRDDVESMKQKMNSPASGVKLEYAYFLPRTHAPPGL